MLINLAIFTEAGGNPTALVTDNIPFEKHKDVGRSIIETSMHWSNSPPVEQVAFLIEKKDRFLKFRMAGGENCGNAIIAMGAYAIDMEDGKSSVEIVLGEDQTDVRSERTECITEEKLTKIGFNLKRLEIETIGEVTIVHLDGISHAVISVPSPGQVEKDDIKTLLDGFNIIKKPASGIMYVSNAGDSIYLNPFVYVEGVSLTNETACGSGSVAAGIWKVLREGKDIVDFPIIQKTGEPIFVTINRSASGSLSANISADVSLLYEGLTNLPIWNKKTETRL
jgi:diaminopimelate epimerase